MFKPSFQVVLNKECFYPDKFACLGTQLICVINFVKDILEPYNWYGADIDCYGKAREKFNLNFEFIKQIGPDSSLIEICSEVDQFLSGVFFAITNKYSTSKSIPLKVDTEDKPFRALRVEGIVLEIRAFDTSFFEIFSEDEAIIKKLSEKFKSPYNLKT